MSLNKPVGILKPNSNRSLMWRKCMGSLEVPIKSPLTERILLVNGKGGEQEARVFWVDLERLDQEQTLLLAEEMAKKFEVSLEEVLTDIEQRGIPVLCEDVTVVFDGRTMLEGEADEDR